MQKDGRAKIAGQLAEAPSREKFEALLKKVEILKGIEGLHTAADDASSSIENLVQQKNRRLETQLVQLKEAQVIKEKAADELQVQVDTLTERVKQQKALIKKLEEDVLQSYSGSSGFDDNIPPPPGSNSIASALPRTDSMLKIVCSQRDRVQSKLQKVEAVSVFGMPESALMSNMNMSEQRRSSTEGAIVGN